MLSFLTGALKGLWGYVAAAGAALVAVLAIYRSGKQSGVNEVVVKTKEKEVEDVKKAVSVARKVDATPADDRAKLLRQRWSRK